MVFVTGDLHGNFERFKPKYFPEQARMTKQDIMICAGDFGGVWFGDSRDDETLDRLERLPFTLVFVCGNHENYDALERYPVDDWHGGKVHRVRPHVLHLMRGQIFELEGCRFFTMGGAKSHDIEDGILEPDAPDFERRLMILQRKPRARYRINHISWWAQELPSDEEYAERFRAISTTMEELKRRKAAILSIRQEQEQISRRIHAAASAMTAATVGIIEWDDGVVYQMLEKVTVLAGNRIKVTFRNGVEIEQIVDQPKRRKFA